MIPLTVPIDRFVEDVSEHMFHGRWNEDNLNSIFPIDIEDHTKQELVIIEETRDWDKPWWMLTSSCKFTVSSAWNILRQKEEEQLVC